MIQIEVKIDHLGELIADLKEVIGNIKTQPLLEDAGAYMLNRIRTRFLSEKDPDDAPWKPSKAAVKRREAGGTGTLFDTGKLFKSIQFAFTGGKDDEATISTDVPYAPYLHYGFVHWLSKEKIGPWPFMGISQKDADVLELILIKRVEEQIEKGMGDEY